MTADVRGRAEALFRLKYGELLSSLLHTFGYGQFDAVEEALQTAFERALERWSASGVPENPSGWLFAVARNTCVERLRHMSMAERKAHQLRAEQADSYHPSESSFDTPAGLDEFASMILLCCNPDLSERAQLCLTLKAACGLSVREIARLLGLGEEAVKKAITRAKEKVSHETAPFKGLDHRRINERFPLVLETVYALFTEGYAASSGDLSLRRDVATQALHLGDVLINSRVTPGEWQGALHALVALMLLQLARFDARVRFDGVPVRLEDQDRGHWNQALIRAGLDALREATASRAISTYHLEARIAAEHSTSPSFAVTNWRLILELYDQLVTLKDTAAVRLNRIVAMRYARGPAAALAELDGLAQVPASAAFLRHTVRADCLDAAGRFDEGQQAWTAALTSAPTSSDRSFVEGRLRSGRGNVPVSDSRSSS